MIKIKTLINNGNIVFPDCIVKNSFVINDETISFDTSSYDDVFEAEGLYVCPGFVDIHTHGGGGYDFMDTDPVRMENAMRFYSQNGTTTVVATTVAAGYETLQKAIDALKPFVGKQIKGCRIAGIHLEGPFLSAKNKGAHRLELLGLPDDEAINFVIKNRDVVTRVTVAPDLDGIPEFIGRISSLGILISGGHDGAFGAEIKNAVKRGMTHVTHLFCAMSTAVLDGITRKPGLVETALTDQQISVELIADGYHLTPEHIKMAYLCKGKDKMCIISDSLRASGLNAESEQTYTLGSGEGAQTFKTNGDVAVLPDMSRLAGSVQPLSKMIPNLLSAGIPFVEAIGMATAIPAKIMKLQDIGEISEGKRADLCIIDKNHEVISVFCGGLRIK